MPMSCKERFSGIGNNLSVAHHVLTYDISLQDMQKAVVGLGSETGHQAIGKQKETDDKAIQVEDSDKQKISQLEKELREEK